jgi:ABC-2 type transport system ATP-binding protein
VNGAGNRPAADDSEAPRPHSQDNELNWRMHMAAIEIQGLSKRFGEVAAVDDLSFTAREGAVTGFLGPNGAGKSTTLRMLLGLVRPSQGSATIGGKPYAAMAEPFRRVGAVLEADAFHLRVRATAAGLPLARVDAVLREVDLADVGHRRVKGFSLGMRQRLGLASALLGEPEVLILDEPANGLDPEGVHWLRQFVRAFADGGGTVLVSSHVLAEVAQTVDDVVIIANGGLVTQSSLAELANRSRSGVRVRTPQAEALRGALLAQGISAQLVAADALVALESTAEAVGLVAAGIGAVIYEMTPEHFNLEEMFLELTTSEGASR